jgi:AcrR family transcriptional regulator
VEGVSSTEDSGKYQQILDAAIGLFSERGFDSASIQDIAQAAGVAKGTVYLYFKSKDDLMDQVYKHCYELDIKACGAGLEKESHAIDKLCLRMDNIIEYLLTHPKEARIEQMYKLSISGKKGSSFYQEEMYQAIYGIVEEGIGKGELRDMPAALLTQIYYGMANGLYHGFQDDPKLWEQEKIREQCHQLIRDSMANRLY